jgi:hypothetical protein
MLVTVATGDWPMGRSCVSLGVSGQDGGNRAPRSTAAALGQRGVCVSAVHDVEHRRCRGAISGAGAPPSCSKSKPWVDDSPRETSQGQAGTCLATGCALEAPCGRQLRGNAGHDSAARHGVVTAPTRTSATSSPNGALGSPLHEHRPRSCRVDAGKPIRPDRPSDGHCAHRGGLPGLTPVIRPSNFRNLRPRGGDEGSSHRYGGGEFRGVGASMD